MAAPIRHGKSTLIKLMIVWLFVNNPKLRIAIFGYGQKFTEDNTYDLREMIPAAGIRVLMGADTKDGMRFEAGGALIISSVEGRAYGLSFNIAIVDDPFKGPHEAYSKTERDKVYEWFMYVIHNRVPANGSIVIIASRWDVDDLSGRLMSRHGYEEMFLQAINDNGEALCPWGPNPDEPRTLEHLIEMRDGKSGKAGLPAHAWAALYQGRPIPRETAVFRGSPPIYTSLPGTMKKAAGYDGGFTEKTDHSAMVVLGFDGQRYYILEAHRWQRRFDAVAAGIAGVMRRHPNVSLYTYYSGAEIQAVQTLQDHYDLDVVAMPARYHKAFRAERAADAWTKGKIAIPSVASWDLAWFMSEVQNFTGAEGDEDDGVDALVAAFDGIDDTGSQLVPGFYGKRCM